jgi:predicted regulator of Ras-like GTPase activity (Roadblock/LC7/MglB family)
VTEDFRRDLRGILLVSLFIVVVPLLFFPKDFGLRFDSSVLLLFALELAWYLLVLFVTFKGQAAAKLFLLALSTLGYRIGLGIGFAILLLVMFSLPLSSSLRLGVHRYLPSLLLETLMAPFVLRSLFAVIIKKSKASGAAERGSVSEMPVKEERPQQALYGTLTKPKEKTEGNQTVSFEKESGVIGENRLENVLHYLREYAGVKAAILVDCEGLVMAEDTVDFDPESVASFARCFKEINDQMLDRMGQKASERIGIHTPDLWVCLNQIGDFTLVVLSDRRTDELLSVRISQSIGMIKKSLAERYGQNELKAVEV